MKKYIYLSAAVVVGVLGSVANAETVFDATTTNTTVFDNAVNSTGTLELTGGTPDLLLANSNGNFNQGGIASTDDINTLNGTALVATDVVTLTAVVDSVANTGSSELRSRGIEFGLAAAPAHIGTLPSNNLVLQIGGAANVTMDNVLGVMRLQNSFGTITSPVSRVAEESVLDGFEVTLVADANGFNFSFTGLDVFGTTNPVADVSGTFLPGEFVANFGTGHYYAAAQKRNFDEFNPGTTTLDFSTARIEVTSVAVPEPTCLALLGLASIGMVSRRRR